MTTSTVYSADEKRWIVSYGDGSTLDAFVTSDPYIDDDGDECDGDDYILIDLVYVAKEDRRKGIARQLIKTFLEAVADTSYSIRLVALPKEGSISQSDLVAFYESCGFSPEDEQPCDGVIMGF